MKSEEKKLFKKMDSSKKTTVKLLRIIGLRGGEGGGGEGVHRRIFLMKINTTFNTYMLYQQYSFVILSFLFKFLWRWINSNKF